MRGRELSRNFGHNLACSVHLSVKADMKKLVNAKMIRTFAQQDARTPKKYRDTLLRRFSLVAFLSLVWGLFLNTLAAQATWTEGKSMLISQWDVANVLLQNGKLLVIDSGARSAELYDPVAGTWTATTGMAGFRVHHSTTLLPNGKVLVAGGWDNNYLATAELYDPDTGTWTTTGSMHQAREYHAAILLPDGNVLVVGGIPFFGGETATAELYNPTTETWTFAGSLNAARNSALSVLLPDGRVMIAGGYTTNGFILDSTELYDPLSKTWTRAGSLHDARLGWSGLYHATATLLATGKVLVAGGHNDSVSATSAISSAEIFDPATATWSITTPLPGPRAEHTATLLPNGEVLVAGGTDGLNHLATALLYDPASGSWKPTGSLSIARTEHGAALLPNGRILVMAGDADNGLATATTELYDSSMNLSAAAQIEPLLWLAAQPLRGVTLSFSGIPGSTYTVQRRPSISVPWSNVVTITVNGSGIASFAEAKPAANNGFYRTTH
jgi:N-acetylneuraminic acid mutarotase